MKDETTNSYPDLCYSFLQVVSADNSLSSICTESVTPSLDSTNVWDHLPVKKYIQKQKTTKGKGYV